MLYNEFILNVWIVFICLLISISENPSAVFPSLDEDVKVTVNSNGLPSVVLPSIGITWDGSDPQSVEEDPLW